MLLSLLAGGLSLASVRMDGLGLNLAGLIDDPVTDMLAYPQLNVIRPGWLAGVEMSPTGYYYPYIRATGRVSVAAALDVSTRYSRVYWSPSLAFATPAGPLSIGASAGVGLTDVPLARPMPGYPWGYSMYDWRDIGNAVLGARWRRAGLTLDVNVNGGIWELLRWDGGDTLAHRWQNLRLGPELRVGLPGEHHSWRGIVSYTYHRVTGASDRPPWVEHVMSLQGGPAYRTRSLLAAAGLQATVRSSSSGSVLPGWSLLLLMGIEWTPGWFVFRCGTDVGVSFAPSWWGPLSPGFDEPQAYLGLGLGPVKRLRLDFTPDIHDLTNLHGCELAASFEF